MIWVAVIFLFLSVVLGIGAAIGEELGLLFTAWLLSLITVLIVVEEMQPKTSDKGYNVWKSYTISGGDTTDVTWHVSEKK